jgi:50S ribosomal protein L16 3-hydroxylase
MALCEQNRAAVKERHGREFLMKSTFLAGLTHSEFLRRHWQKKPLLARNALKRYAGMLSRENLFVLAQRDDIESRIVRRTRDRWHVEHGPFKLRDLQRLPPMNWTLLVQGVETALAAGARLLREFAFVPYARLDDLMVSYATPQGGVGPHFDSYDVFLVQSQGRRCWRVSRQRDLDLVADAPLKILRKFAPDREWTVSPGDVLYLPPRYAHDGIAIDECITCSVGFRSPASQELASRFLDFLQDRLQLDGIYEDRDLEPASRPARLPDAMIDHTASVLREMEWSHADVVEFIGRYLSEPKNTIVFARPSRPLSRPGFARQILRRGVHLAPATRMLFHRHQIFVNGERTKADAASATLFRRFANARELAPDADVPEGGWDALYGWYLAGYITLGPA